MAVLHLQGGACRRGAPCWRASYSERQEEKEAEEEKENKLSFGVETTSGDVQVLVMSTSFTLTAVSVKGSDSLDSEGATCPTQSIHQIGSKFR